MADRHVDHLVVGGGIAGATCARTLREKGARGPVLLVGREPDAPYHRPPITKEYLRGENTREQGLILEAGWWEEHDVELRTRTSVMGLDVATATATLSDRSTVSYERALLATGAMVRRLGVDGAGLEGIHYLRALANADALREDVQGAERVVLVGGSYVGCEVAASLTEMGKRCTIVMQEAVTFERSFGAAVGGALQAVLEAHGIEVLGGEDVASFEGAGDPGRVAAVVLASGRRLPADLVVAGVGAIPDLTLARKSGLAIGAAGGVKADRLLASSDSRIYVAGDICEYDSALHGASIRIEHEQVAASQGQTAARNMLGQRVPYTTVPYFFSDLSDWAALEYVGGAQRWDEEALSGSLEDLDFCVTYLSGGEVVAALSVGRRDEFERARAQLAGRAAGG